MLSSSHIRHATDRTASTVTDTPRWRKAEGTIALLVVALLFALPATIGAQAKVLVLSELSVEVTEEGTDGSIENTATYTVGLNTKPTGPVTVTVASNDPKAAKVHTGSGVPGDSIELSFNTRFGSSPGNWNTPHTVTVTGQPDKIDNEGGGRFPTIMHAPIGGGFRTGESLFVVVHDDGDTASLELSACPDGDISSSINEGDTTTYCIKLSSEPTGPVTVTVTSDDISVAKVDPVSLTFTPKNSETPQMVTVTSVDDEDNPDNRSVTITHAPRGGGYDAVAVKKVTIEVVNAGQTDRSETKGLTVTPSAVSVSEAAGKVHYTVRLNALPDDFVTVALTNSDTRAATVSPSSLTFAPSNWKKPQTVTVTGLDDEVDNNDPANSDNPDSRPATITHIPRGGGYDAVEPKILTVTINNDDADGVTVSRKQFMAVENTKPLTYTVVLDTKPADEVMVSPTSTDSYIALSPDILTFTPSSWDQEQKVTIEVTKDDLVNSSRSATISHAVTGAYSGVTAPSVTVSITDDELARVNVSKNSISISDADGENSSTYEVWLEYPPATGDVTVRLTVLGDTGAVTTDPASGTTFDLSGTTRQTITVTGEDDAVDNSGESRSVTIAHTVDETSGGYAGVTVPSVSVRVDDDDVSDLSRLPTSVSISEAGGENMPQVWLKNPPATGDVTVRLTVLGDTGAVTTDPASGTTFDLSGTTRQTITVTGVDDAVDNPGESRSVTLRFEPTNADKGFDLPVTVRDKDDTRGLKFTALGKEVTSLSEVRNYSVELKSRPTEDVFVTVTSNYPSLRVSSSSIEFDSDSETDWAVPKLVTLAGDDLGKPSGFKDVFVTHTAIGGDYDGEAKNLPVRVTKPTKDELLQVTPKPVLTIEEGDPPIDYSVRLSEPPTLGRTVVVSVTSSSNAATVSPKSLTFTRANWRDQQNVTVTSVPDFARGNRTATITFAPRDGGYNSTQTERRTLTVTDSTRKGLLVLPSSVEVSEGQRNTFEVALNAEPTGTVTVAVASDNASVATVNPKSLTFTSANWNQSQRVTITGVPDDKVNAANRTADIELDASGGGYDDVEEPSVSVSVTDDDATVTVSSTSVTVPEASGKATYTMKLDGEPTGTVTLTVESSDRTAATVSPGSLTFTPSNWSTLQTVTVTGVDDSSPGGSRSATITHTASGGGYDDVEVRSVRVSVTDDDGLMVSPAAVTVAEAGGRDTYTVRLRTPPASNVTVTANSNDTSIATVSPGSLTFTPSNWSTPQTVTVTGVNDDLDSGASRSATITNTPSGAGYSSNNRVTVAVTVTDDEDAPTLAISGGEATEGNTGTRPLTFTVTKSGGTDQEVTVAYADAGTGTATAGTDYTAVPAGTLTFAPEETSKTLTVMVQGDDVSEPDETVVIALSRPTHATIAQGRGAATGTIIDDDASLLSIAAGAARVDEGEPLIFTVTLDPPIADQQVTVEVDSGGTATAGTDYMGVPETLTFAAGEAAKTITVEVEDDADYEPDETVEVELRNPRPPGDVVIETGEAMVTIVDNDDPPALSISGMSVAEGNDGTTSKLTFKVTKSGGTSMSATVAYADAGTGTATAGTDYTAVPAGTLTFAPEETSKTITVVVKGDDVSEGDETVVIRLSSPSNATIAEGKGAATGTIIDDDTLPRVATDWLARFGRTAAGATLDAIARRMNDGPAAEPSLTVAGHRAAFAPEPVGQAAAATAAPWEEGWARALTIEELANGSSFDAGDNFVEGLNVWAATSYNQFEMTPQGDYTMDGSLMSAILGVDHQGDTHVAGLALAYHGGSGDFGGIGKTEGSLGTNLYSVHPYVRLTFGEMFHIGGSFGLGTGDLSITDKDGDALVETGVGMPVLAAVDARMELSLAEAWLLALQADGHLVQMVADERLPRFTRVETNTHRLRLVVENSYVFLVADGVSLAPVLETGLRYDGGDAVETGFGVDVGGGLRLDATVAAGLMVDARGHASLNNWGEGQEQAPVLRDWGLGGVIRWRPAGGGMGPEMSLAPAYGGTLGAAAPSLSAEIGYRLPAFGGVLTPYSSAELAGGGQRSYSAGARFEVDRAVEVSAEGTHRQPTAGDVEQVLTLRVRLRQ